MQRDDWPVGFDDAVSHRAHLVADIDAPWPHRSVQAAGSAPRSRPSSVLASYWQRAASAQSRDQCDPTRRYLVLAFGAGGPHDRVVALFALDAHGAADTIAFVTVGPAAPATQWSSNPFMLADALPTAIAPFRGDLLPFLATLADTSPFERLLARYRQQSAASAMSGTTLAEEGGETKKQAARRAEARDETLMQVSAVYPTPAGAQQVKRALTPLASQHDVPYAVYQELARNVPEQSWAGRVHGVWLDECQLVTALQLFRGQVRARHARPLFASNRTLADRAASVYANALAPDARAPPEVLDRAAAFAWQNTCAADASPDGRLPHEKRLSDVAQHWGLPIGATQHAAPGLLCDALAPHALQSVLYNRYNERPTATATAGGQPFARQYATWARACSADPNADLATRDRNTLMIMAQTLGMQNIDRRRLNRAGYACAAFAPYMVNGEVHPPPSFQ